jgi:plasmid segregation protein ParM
MMWYSITVVIQIRKVEIEMAILGIDAGNNEVKVVTDKGAYKFRSCLGEYRDRRLKDTHGDSDMEWEYQDEKGFAGTLAERESYHTRDMMGSSKAHQDAKLRILLAVHRYSDDVQNDIVVGQPIERHTEDEKRKIKEMLIGSHTMTVNGKEKKFKIRSVEVAAEGAGAFYTDPEEGLVRIIDIGSGTVNAATLLNKRYVDRESTTLEFGTNTSFSQDPANLKHMTRALATTLRKQWKEEDKVYVVGGVAETVLEVIKEYFPKAEILYPRLLGEDEVENLSPIFSNAAGFYNIARMVHSE